MRRFALLPTITALAVGCESATQPTTPTPSGRPAPRLTVVPSETGIPVTVLGHGEALDINQRGQVVGWSFNAAGDQIAVSWDGEETTDLGAPAGLVAWAVNERGQIAIGSPFPGPAVGDAYLWEKGELTLIGHDLRALGINARGQVVGRQLGTGADHGFVWSAGQITFIDPLPGNAGTVAVDVNDAGRVVGFSAGGGGDVRAFVWDKGVTQPLPTPAGYFSRAFEINNMGEIAGSIISSAGENRAVLWRDGELIDLGTLGGTNSRPWGMDDRGRIVGWSNMPPDDRTRPFLWPDASGEMMNLGRPIGVEYEGPTIAYAINNRGQIVGGGGSTPRAYVWNP